MNNRFLQILWMDDSWLTDWLGEWMNEWVEKVLIRRNDARNSWSIWHHAPTWRLPRRWRYYDDTIRPLFGHVSPHSDRSAACGVLCLNMPCWHLLMLSMSLVVSVCAHPTWPRSSSHPRSGQLSATVPSQWPHQGLGNVCSNACVSPGRDVLIDVSSRTEDIPFPLYNYIIMDIIINLFHPFKFFWPSTHILLTM